MTPTRSHQPEGRKKLLHPEDDRRAGRDRQPTVVVDQDARGDLDYNHPATLVSQRCVRPAGVVATAGTTMTEVVDSASIAQILDRHGVPDRHVHVDAALAGVPLALDGRLRFGPDIDSISISGHTWLGTPVPRGRFVWDLGEVAPQITGSEYGQARDAGEHPREPR